MNTVRMFLSRFVSVIKHDGSRRRQRVERGLVVEPMEPRALLSALAASGTTVVPPRHAFGALVVPINEPPTFHVMYQANRAGVSLGFARPAPVAAAPTSQGVSAGTIDVTAADQTSSGTTDDTDGDSDDGTGDDSDGDAGDDDSDDNGDGLDDENDPDSGP